MGRKLRKSKDKVFAGVAGGIAQYFEIDPTIIRLIFVITSFMGLTGVIAYIIAAFVMPEYGSYKPNKDFFSEEYDPDKDFTKVMGDDMEKPYVDHEKNSKFIGTSLVLLGLFFIAKEYLQFDMKFVWPLIFMLAGGFIILRGRRK